MLEFEFWRGRKRHPRYIMLFFLPKFTIIRILRTIMGREGPYPDTLLAPEGHDPSIFTMDESLGEKLLGASLGALRERLWGLLDGS